MRPEKSEIRISQITELLTNDDIVSKNFHCFCSLCLISSTNQTVFALNN